MAQRARAEDFARFKQYDYAANSNLVLTAEQRPSGASEPDGSAESLYGRLKGAMGDRALRELPSEAKRGASGERGGAEDSGPSKRARTGGPSILDLEAAGTYRPRTRETREAYEALLSVIAAVFGEQPGDVLRGAAEEVVSAVRDEGLLAPARQKGVEALLGPLSEERYAAVVELSQRLTDWAPAQAEGGEEGLDEDVGVAVEFDDSEEEREEEGGGEGLLRAIQEEDEEEDGEGGEEGRSGGPSEGAKDLPNRPSLAHARELDPAASVGASAVPRPRAPPSAGLEAQAVDAYWLQRRVARALPELEPSAAQALAEQVLAALGLPEAREAESRLVALLDVHQFALIKELLAHRGTVYWCTRLARAQSAEERAGVAAEAGESEAGRRALEALQLSRASARERAAASQAALREEARRLREGDGDDGAGADKSRAPPPSTPARSGEQRADLDLEALAFSQGGHLNTAKTCTLPAGSFRTVHKGWEEVRVPAPEPPASSDPLVRVSSLPPWARHGFAGMESLNRVQSRVHETALYRGDNLLLCAPTGAGKTNVAMLAMLQTIGRHMDQGALRRGEGGDKPPAANGSAFKMVYIAPMKALVAEMVGNFARRLAPYGLSVKELTGDAQPSPQELAEAQLLVATPEKWDVVTRNAADRDVARLLQLLILDEVHLLHDSRGAVLESIVARTLGAAERAGQHVRLVGLSATLPNYRDVAAFLRVDEGKGLFFFDASYRPCPLAQRYLGVSVKQPLQRFRLQNELCYDAVLSALDTGAVIVFVHSRKDTAKTAKFLRDEALSRDELGRVLRAQAASREVLAAEAEGAALPELRDLLPHGFAVHHAGMGRADRTLVEDLFGDGHVRVLVSTATLAWGVNLPAHTVVIKGTQVYSPERGAWTELSPLDMVQMLGRAGRPQYDAQGEGVIITTHSQLQFYLSLLNEQLPVESQLVAHLPDALNAELVLGQVTDADSAAAWLGDTYLFVRMLASPELYGVPAGALAADPRLLRRRLDLAHAAFRVLDKAGLARFDARAGAAAPTELGRVASRFYASHRTLRALDAALRPGMTDVEQLRCLAGADEFKSVVVREDEKLELARLLERVPIPVRESLDDPAAKVNVLVQAWIARLPLEGLALAADATAVAASAPRLLRCLHEVALRRGLASVAERALVLARCAGNRQWACASPLRQFPGVPADVLARIERKELAWERWHDLSAAEIGELLRLPRAGKTVHRLVHALPRLELSAAVHPLTRSCLEVALAIAPDFGWDARVHGAREDFLVLVTDGDGERVLHSQRWGLTAAASEEESTIVFHVPLVEPLPPQIFVRVLSQRWLGADASLPISFRHLVLPDRFPAPTELVDLQALPVSQLPDPRFRELYRSFGALNAVQTQVYSQAAGTDHCLLLAAPDGCGKTVVAELALMRFWAAERERLAQALQAAADPPPRRRIAAYVAPLPELADACFAEWQERFAGPSSPFAADGLRVVRLRGEAVADARLLDGADLAVGSAREWDRLTRRWRARKAVQRIGLCVAGDLQLLGSDRPRGAGACLEACLSRLRFMSSQLPLPVRVVALSAPLADARDAGDWIGAPPRACFSFGPGARAVPLDLRVQSADDAALHPRSRALARPVFRALAGEDQLALVFAAGRRAARDLASDLLAAAAVAGAPRRWARLDGEEGLGRALAAAGSRDRELALAAALGVAWLTEAQPRAVRALLLEAAEADSLGVLVASQALLWELGPLRARLVVVAGTRDDAGVELPLAALQRCLGRAGRPGRDARSGAVLLCAEARKASLLKFCCEALPLHSRLDAALHDALVAEVAAGVVRSKQEAVDWITWSFYYRHLARNPNYYGMEGVSHRHVSDHLSELVERVVGDLEASRTLAVADEVELEPLNLGMIAAYYGVAYTTLELFAAGVGAKTRLKGLLELLAAASEFDDLPVRDGEDEVVRSMLQHAPLGLERPRYRDPHTKVNALLQAHFSRARLSADLALDLGRVLEAAPRLLQALVDVTSSGGWLAPALGAMELSQMAVQGLWLRDSPLLQIPHFTPALAAACAAAGADGVFGLLDLDAPERERLLVAGGLQERERADVEAWGRRYPDVAVELELQAGGGGAGEGQGLSEDAPLRCRAGEPLRVAAQLAREGGEEEAGAAGPGPVLAPRFPGAKEEAWWVVAGDAAAETLLAIKRVVLQRAARVSLDLVVPEEPGPRALKIVLMCDSYVGCDQEFEVFLDILPAQESMAQG